MEDSHNIYNLNSVNQKEYTSNFPDTLKIDLSDYISGPGI